MKNNNTNEELNIFLEEINKILFSLPLDSALYSPIRKTIDSDLEQLRNSLNNSIYLAINNAKKSATSEEMKSLLTMLSTLLKNRENDLLLSFQEIKNNLTDQIKKLKKNNNQDKIIKLDKEIEKKENICQEVKICKEKQLIECDDNLIIYNEILIK